MKNNDAMAKTANVDLIIQAALNLNAAGEDQRVLELLDYALQFRLDSAQIFILLGLSHNNLGETAKAEKNFRKAVEINPRNDEALQSLGLFLVENNNQSEGADWLRKYIEMGNWGDHENLQELINIYTELELQEEVTELLTKAWAETKKLEIGRMYGNHLQSIDKQEDAIVILERVADTTEDPNDYFKLALALWIDDQYEKVIRYLEKAVYIENQVIGAEPGFTYDEYEDAGYEWPIVKDVDFDKIGWYEYLIASSYVKLEDGEKALKTIESAISHSGSTPHEFSVKTEALNLLKRYDEAIQAADIGISWLDESYGDWGAELYLQKASAQLKSGDLDAALQTLKQGIETYPTDYYLYLEAITLYDLQDRHKEAIQLFEQAFKGGVGIKRSLFVSIYLSTLEISGKISISDDFLDRILKEYSEDEFDDFLSEHLSGLTMSSSIESVFQRITDQYPSNPAFLHMYAWAQFQQDKLTEAEKMLQKSLDLDPSDNEALYILNNLGYIYLLQNRPTEAENVFEKVYERTQHENDYKNSATLLVAFYKDSKIIPEYMSELYRSLTPKQSARANLAALALSLGNYDRATGLAIEILADKHDNSLGYEVLGFISLAKEEFLAAKEALKGAQERVDAPNPFEILQGFIDEIDQSLAKDNV